MVGFQVYFRSKKERINVALETIDGSAKENVSLKPARILFFCAYAAYILGQSFRLQHWPFAALLIMISALGLLAAVFIGFRLAWRAKKKSWAYLHTGIFLCLVFITARSMYYLETLALFSALSAILILLIFLSRNHLNKYKILTGILALCFLLSVLLQVLPRHKIYYFTNIRGIEGYGMVIGSSPHLSFYSYLLYCDEQYEEALKYNAKAFEQSQIDIKEISTYPENLGETIKSQRVKIEKKNWYNYEE